jgi:hypothetical protein
MLDEFEDFLFCSSDLYFFPFCLFLWFLFVYLYRNIAFFWRTTKSFISHFVARQKKSLTSSMHPPTLTYFLWMSQSKYVFVRFLASETAFSHFIAATKSENCRFHFIRHLNFRFFLAGHKKWHFVLCGPPKKMRYYGIQITVTVFCLFYFTYILHRKAI